jgi:hypothetical protein
VTTSTNSDSLAELVAELGRIELDTTYYALTLTASSEGEVQWGTQTQFVGSGSKPMWEMRAASPVIPDHMRDLWNGIGQKSIVVNSKRALMLLMRAGGNGVVAEPLFKEWFGRLLQPVECVPTRLGEGVRSRATATPAQLQHAPSRSMRMEALKRDEFRCRACGQRPSEDVNVILHVHHVRPFGQGGLTEMHNLLTLCQTCHTGLDPHFEFQLLSMVPDGMVAPDFEVAIPDTDFADGVQRYRAVVAAQLDELAAEAAD